MVYIYVSLVTQLCPTLCDTMDCSLSGCLNHGGSPGKNTGMGYHTLLQGIFPTQGANPGLPYCRQILHHLNHQGSPGMVQICLINYLPPKANMTYPEFLISLNLDSSEAGVTLFKTKQRLDFFLSFSLLYPQHVEQCQYTLLNEWILASGAKDRPRTCHIV